MAWWWHLQGKSDTEALEAASGEVAPAACGPSCLYVLSDDALDSCACPKAQGKLDREALEAVKAAVGPDPHHHIGVEVGPPLPWRLQARTSTYTRRLGRALPLLSPSSRWLLACQRSGRDEPGLVCSSALRLAAPAVSSGPDRVTKGLRGGTREPSRS